MSTNSAYSLDPVLVKTIQSFVEMLKAQPNMIHSPDLKFLKDYLIAVGARIPNPPEEETKSGAGDTNSSNTKSSDPGPRSESPKVEEVDEEMEDEPFPELSHEGVIDEDEVDANQDMGNADAEPSEEAVEKSNELRSEAVGLFGEGNFEACVGKYTEAIKLNGSSAALFAKRGQAYLRLQKPNACIKDCTRALELNPDSAMAYKFRGRAHRLLGHWEESATDLRQACNIDNDEQSDEWLKEVQPHARQVEEWRLRKKRRDEERELKQRKARAQQRARAHSEAQREERDAPSAEDFLGGMPGLSNVMNDPEVVELFADPEVSAAFQDIGQNPANILKHQSNPKVAKLLSILQSKLGGGGRGGGGMGGGFPGMGGMGGGMPGGGFPGMGGGFPGMAGMGGGMPGGFPGGMPGFGGFGGAPPGGNPPPQPTPKPPADDLD